MKVGIITFHFPHNYGAMLQAYAMQQKLLSMGHDAYVIDYAPEYHTKWYSRGRSFWQCFVVNPIATVKHLTGYFLANPTQTKRYDGFEEFKNHNMRLFPYNPHSDFHEFDAILLGSDQIWDMAHTNNMFDGPYYGDGFKCKVFSYAASSKHKQLTEEQAAGFRDRINKLYSIGVREESLKSLLQPLTAKHIYINLDPTLIAGQELFAQLKLGRPIRQKYVLIYELNEHKEVIEMANAYARQINAKVVSLVAYFNWKKRFQSIYDQCASPERFVSYIKNAECIFTSSFHGTSLSLVFEKSFYCVRQNTNSDLRMESLLKQLGLLNRFIKLTDKPVYDEIDYTQVNKELESLRKSSEEYLNEALTANNPF